jgi:hypothetical protein
LQEFLMLIRLLTSFGVLLIGLSGIGTAQEACKTEELPVGVISVTGEIFRGLAAEDFSGHIQKKPVGLKSLTYDDGPRRVVIVLDASQKLSADTRKAEATLVETMLATARPEDSFALLPARGPGREVDFTTDRQAITAAIGGSSGKQGREPGVLDAVMAGIERFGAPQSGDAIVVIAAELEGNHKANAKTVARALQEHHIRMFGLALGPVSTRNITTGGSMTSTTSQGLAWTTPGIGDFTYNTGDENFFPLTVNSGGLLLGVMNMDSRRSYQMSNPRMVQEVQQKARSVSKMIDAFYRMQVEPPPLSHVEDWNLDINDSIKKHSQPMFVIYPHVLGPC